MDTNARRFARRILVINGLLLLAVLLVVLMAAHEIYRDTREEVIAQSKARQRMLADETARGIENQYRSIVDVMDLMHTETADDEDGTATTTGSVTTGTATSGTAMGTTTGTTGTVESEAEKASQRNVERAATAPRNQVIGEVMWEQLKSRAGALYAVELRPPANRTSARPPTGQTDRQGPDRQNSDRQNSDRGNNDRTGPNANGTGGPGRGGPFKNPGSENPGEVARPILRGNGNRDPGASAIGDVVPGNPARNGAAQRGQSAAFTRTIGVADGRLVEEQVIEQCRPWFATIKDAPSIGPMQNFNGLSANVICVPVRYGRALAAVVPVRGVEARFLDPLKSPMTAVWLTDDQGTVLASSMAGLDGENLASNGGLPTAGTSPTTGPRHSVSAPVEMTRPFLVGTVKFDPSIMLAETVDVAGKRWTLYVTTSMADVDEVVKPLFHRALAWCVFVVLSITAILVSTAVQMIRNRIRSERLRHEMLTRELDQARRIQLAWLPAAHDTGDDVDVAAVNQPASHISGDFYNWFEIPDGRMVVTIGDVTGHGMAAAFLMATTQLLVRNTMARMSDPGDCLAEVNRQLCVQVFNGQFVTMLVLVLDAAGGHLQIATAGHPAPLMADGESFQPLEIEPQLVLGVDPEATYVTQSFDLPAEATLLLYTDGVVECPDAKDARFGNERLKRALYGRYDSAKTIVDQVVKAVDEFRGAKDLDDDLTVVALQLQATRAKRPGSAVGV